MLWFSLLILSAIIGASIYRPRKAPADEPFKHLVPGRTYEVVERFRDAAMHEWENGDDFEFAGFTYTPSTAVLTLLLAKPERTMTFIWRNDGQGHIVDNLANYIVERA